MQVNISYSDASLAIRKDHSITKQGPNKGYNPLFLISMIIVFLAIISLLLYATNGFSPKNGEVMPQQPTETPTPSPTENPRITIDEPSVTEGGHFFEKTPVIEGQQAYIAYPKEIQRNSPPTLILYSHGSITTITTDFSDDFMQDMRAYGDFFTKNGYIFAASAEHGANWGSQAAVNDKLNLIKWVGERYPMAEKVNLVAHSMGGLVTIKFGMQNPGKVSKMALLAPTSYPTTYKRADYEKLLPIDITIWHGNKDVNVPWSLSNQFVATAKKYGKIITLNTLEGKTHWDVDTELKEEILDFYEISVP